jgi:hypothetical protein
MTAHTVYSRELIEVNTDPQRRCYYGVHAKSENVWTHWAPLYDLRTAEEAQESVESWRALAKSARPRVLEYKAVPVGEQP